MKTLFPKKECHIPKWFIIDASNKTLGYLATEVSQLLCGKYLSYFNSSVNQNNYIIIINSSKIIITGQKFLKKYYYKNSNRPGSLKIETFKDLKNRIPNRIIEKAIWGMLPKNILGRQYFKNLYIYNVPNIFYTIK